MKREIAMGKIPNGGVMTEVIFLMMMKKQLIQLEKFRGGATLKGLLFCF